MTPPPRRFSRDEVRSHTTDSSLWCIIDSTVYDLTDFLPAHPGGESVLRQVAGQDATSAFYSLHRHEVLSPQQHGARLAIGTVAGEEPQVITPRPGDLSPVPYAESLWLTTPFRSPYYAASHHRLHRAARDFAQRHIAPEALAAEASGAYISQGLIDRMEREGILRMRQGPGPHLHGRELFGGAMRGDDFDYFHFVVLAQEICRPVARGFQDGNMAGMSIGLSTLLHHAAPESSWRERVCDDVFAGRAKMCLAITEAFAGSDVSNIRTTAERTPDGKYFVSCYPGSSSCCCSGSPVSCYVILMWDGLYTGCKRHQEVDYQWYLERLLCHLGTDGQRLHRPAHSPR